MEREKIRIRDVHDVDYPDDWDGFALVETKEKDYDSEKGFVDYECVVKRLSDGKFFKFSYTQYGHNGSSLLEETMVEAFPREKVITVYD